MKTLVYGVVEHTQTYADIQYELREVHTGPFQETPMYGDLRKVDVAFRPTARNWQSSEGHSTVLWDRTCGPLGVFC